MPVEHYTLGESETAHEKKVSLESNKQKIKDMEQVATAQDKVMSGHASLGDEMFGATGGSLMKVLGKEGMTGFLDAQANSIFSGNASGSAGDVKPMGGDLQLAGSSDEPAKKKKRYDIETARENLSASCTESSNKLATSAHESLAKSTVSDQLADDCADVVDGLGRWRQILKTRTEYLKQCIKCACATPGTTVEFTTLLNLL